MAGSAANKARSLNRCRHSTSCSSRTHATQPGQSGLLSGRSACGIGTPSHKELGSIAGDVRSDVKSLRKPTTICLVLLLCDVPTQPHVVSVSTLATSNPVHRGLFVPVGHGTPHRTTDRKPLHRAYNHPIFSTTILLIVAVICQPPLIMIDRTEKPFAT